MSAANVSAELLIMCGALFCFYFIIFVVYLLVDKYLCNKTRKRSSPLKQTESAKGWTTGSLQCKYNGCMIYLFYIFWGWTFLLINHQICRRLFTTCNQYQPFYFENRTFSEDVIEHSNSIIVMLRYHLIYLFAPICFT